MIAMITALTRRRATTIVFVDRDSAVSRLGCSMTAWP